MKLRGTLRNYSVDGGIDGSRHHKNAKLVYVNRDIGLESEDGPFRNYLLQSDGGTLLELEENAVIIERDEDGELFDGAPIGNYPPEVYERCMTMLEDAFDSTEE